MTNPIETGSGRRRLARAAAIAFIGAGLVPGDAAPLPTHTTLPEPSVEVGTVSIESEPQPRPWQGPDSSIQLQDGSYVDVPQGERLPADAKAGVSAESPAANNLVPTPGS